MVRKENTLLSVDECILIKAHSAVVASRLLFLSVCLFNRLDWTLSVCVCACRAPSAMPVTSQLFRGLPRTKVLASGLLPCQHHQSHLAPITQRPASRRPSCMWQGHQHSRSYQTTSALRSYILTPPQVNSILKANEYSFKVCGLIHAHRKHIAPSLHLGFHLTISICCGSRCQSLMGRMCHRWWVLRVISCQPTLP